MAFDNPKTDAESGPVGWIPSGIIEVGIRNNRIAVLAPYFLAELDRASLKLLHSVQVPDCDWGGRTELSETGARWWLRPTDRFPKRYFAATFGKEIHPVPPSAGPDDEKYVPPPFEAVVSEGGIVVKSTTPGKDGIVPQRKVMLTLPSTPKEVWGYPWEGTYILTIKCDDGTSLTCSLPLRSK